MIIVIWNVDLNVKFHSNTYHESFHVKNIFNFVLFLKKPDH